MKVGIVGAGGWGQQLVRTMHELGALGAIAEADETRRAFMATSYPGVQVLDDHRALLEGDLPAVIVATPAVTHHEIGREVLKAGKDLFVEKPLAMSVSEAEELVELARVQDRVLMVGHLLMYQPAVGFIREFLANGSLGSVRSFHQERLNLGRARSVENALWSLGVHDIAVLLHLIGRPPERISAWGHRVLQAEIEDDFYVHLAFEGNVDAHIHTSWLWPQRQRSLTVIGSEGMLRYDEQDQMVVLHRKGIKDDLTSWDRGVELLYRGEGQPLRLELEHFLACVQDRSVPLSDGSSALPVLRVLEEATRAIPHDPLKGFSIYG